MTRDNLFAMIDCLKDWVVCEDWIIVFSVEWVWIEGC